MKGNQMKSRTRFAAIAVLAGLLTGVGAEAAMAAQTTHSDSPPEGGTWNWGIVGGKPGGTTYSEYLHDSKTHGSTAQNSSGANRSAAVSAKKWSSASITATLTGNKSFYRLY